MRFFRGVCQGQIRQQSNDKKKTKRHRRSQHIADRCNVPVVHLGKKNYSKIKPKYPNNNKNKQKQNLKICNILYLFNNL